VVGDGLGLQHLSLSEQKNPAVRQDFSHSQQYLRASGLVQRLNEMLPGVIAEGNHFDRLVIRRVR